MILILDTISLKGDLAFNFWILLFSEYSNLSIEIFELYSLLIKIVPWLEIDINLTAIIIKVISLLANSLKTHIFNRYSDLNYIVNFVINCICNMRQANFFLNFPRKNALAINTNYF